MTYVIPCELIVGNYLELPLCLDKISKTFCGARQHNMCAKFNIKWNTSMFTDDLHFSASVGNNSGIPSCTQLNRPATHPDLIGISRFFSTNLGLSRFPDSTFENPKFLFRFEIGKTKGRLTLLHGPCLQTHKVWAKNICYDRPSPLHTATQRVK